MANYQICDLDEFLKKSDETDEFMSADEYMRQMEPAVEEVIQMPSDFISANAIFDDSEAAKEGEIAKLLRITPGILPPTNSFGRSYSLPKAPKQREYIPKGLGNKIPILLDEKYFKFNHGDETDTVNREIINNLNNLNGNGNGHANRNGNHAHQSSGNSNDTTVDGLTEQFPTLFCDSYRDSNNSDDDNCHVDTPPQRARTMKYYNAREIYLMKRGRKN